MSRKAEIINKEVILIRSEFDRVNLKPIIVVDKFNKCRFFKGTYSVEKDNYRYYCKQEDYYCSVVKNYCLIVDVSKKEEALNSFIYEIECKLIYQISGYKSMIQKMETKLENTRSIKNEINI